ncbi:MAG: NAD/NADP octopine/nopaline dehydrogenase family protein [Promethearchaeota archaeon]
MDSIRIAVIGAGGPGLTLSAFLARAGHQVYLINFLQHDIAGIEQSLRIISKGIFKGEWSLNSVTPVIDTTIRDVELIILAIHPYLHRMIVEQMAPFIKDSQIILSCPSGIWNAIQIRNMLKEKDPELDIFVGEIQDIPFRYKILNDKGIEILEIYEDISYCFYPESDNAYVDYILLDIFPFLKPVNDIRLTSLATRGNIIVPILGVLNAGALMNDDFLIFNDAMPPEIVRVIDDVDKERLSLLNALGLDLSNLRQTLMKKFGGGSDASYESIIQDFCFFLLSGESSSAMARRILWDVNTEMLPLQSLGKILKVPTPVIDSIINLVTSMFKQKSKNDETSIAGMTITPGLLERSKQTMLDYKHGIELMHSNIDNVCESIQTDLLNDWILVSGKKQLINALKKCIFFRTKRLTGKTTWKQYISLDRNSLIIAVIKKSDWIKDALELGPEFKRLCGLSFEGVGAEFTVKPKLYYEDKKQEISDYMKEFKASLYNLFDTILKKKEIDGKVIQSKIPLEDE